MRYSSLVIRSLVMIFALGVFGCSDNPVDSGNPPVDEGTLTIITVTTGFDQDTDGYSLLVDAVATGAIGVNDTRTLQRLDVGSYELELTDLDANCSVSTNHPRTVVVTKDAITTTTFVVNCTIVDI